MKRKKYNKPNIEIIKVELENNFLSGSIIIEETIYTKSELGDYENIEMHPSYISDIDF